MVAATTQRPRIPALPAFSDSLATFRPRAVVLIGAVTVVLTARPGRVRLGPAFGGGCRAKVWRPAGLGPFWDATELHCL